MNEFRIKAIIFEEATKLQRNKQIMCEVSLVQGVYQMRVRRKDRPNMTTYFQPKFELDMLIAPELCVQRIAQDLIISLFKEGE